MLDIHIDNPELEHSIRQTYGDDSNSIARDFVEFIQQRKIKQDIGISIEQLDAGKGIPIGQAINDIRAKYE